MTQASDGPGDLHLATVVVNVQDMRRAVDFWCAALGYRQREAEILAWQARDRAARRSSRTRVAVPCG